MAKTKDASSTLPNKLTQRDVQVICYIMQCLNSKLDVSTSLLPHSLLNSRGSTHR